MLDDEFREKYGMPDATHEEILEKRKEVLAAEAGDRQIALKAKEEMERKADEQQVKLEELSAQSRPRHPLRHRSQPRAFTMVT